MEDEQKLLVGFDLCNDYSQIACYNYKTFEPESICEEKNKEQYLIPTVLGVTNKEKEWVYGQEAIKLANLNGAYLVTDIIELIEKNEEITIYDVNFTGTDLLERFLRKCLIILKKIYPNESILKIVFTLKAPNSLLREALHIALSNLGINEDRFYIQSHTQSYLYYALSQRKELWTNDIGLFDFDESGMNYIQISINRNSNPIIVGTKYKDFSNQLTYHMLTESSNLDEIRYIFEDITKTALNKQIISTIYMTGKGFENNWADDLIASLCVGRRIFKGQNLYVKGACYTARELAIESKLKNFLFLTDEMVDSDILMRVYYDAGIVEVTLASAGNPWYNIESCFDIILDDEQEIEVIIRNILNGNETSQIIALEGIVNEPNKTARVQLRTKFEDNKTCIIAVKDQGFGEFYPSSNRIWEQMIYL